MFGVVDGLDDVLVVSGEVKEAATLTRGAQLGEDVFACQGHQVVGGVEFEFCTKMPKNPGGVILEFEIVLSRGDQFVASAVTVSIALPPLVATRN